MLALDVGRAERAVSTGMDSTCRVWKVADESQLIFRAPTMAVDCCRCLPCAAVQLGRIRRRNEGCVQGSPPGGCAGHVLLTSALLLLMQAVAVECAR